MPLKTYAFERSEWILSALLYTKDTLRVIISHQSGYGASFFLHNTYSSPETRPLKKEKHFDAKRTLETATTSFNVRYDNVTHTILNNSLVDRTVEPHHPLAGNPWDLPFIYEDARHVFYVSTSKRFVRIPLWNRFRIEKGPAWMNGEIPTLVFESADSKPDGDGPIIRQLGFGVVDPSPLKRIISEDVYIRRGVGTGGTVTFGEQEIGPMGSQTKSIRTR